MSNVKSGNKRLMITLPESLVGRLERDTSDRGLNLTKSARIQLALESELNRSIHSAGMVSQEATKCSEAVNTEEKDDVE